MCLSFSFNVGLETSNFEDGLYHSVLYIGLPLGNREPCIARSCMRTNLNPMLLQLLLVKALFTRQNIGLLCISTILGA